jgi:hypothetical protein
MVRLLAQLGERGPRHYDTCTCTCSRVAYASPRQSRRHSPASKQQPADPKPIAAPRSVQRGRAGVRESGRTSHTRDAERSRPEAWRHGTALHGDWVAAQHPTGTGQGDIAPKTSAAEAVSGSRIRPRRSLGPCNDAVCRFFPAGSEHHVVWKINELGMHTQKVRSFFDPFAVDDTIARRA